MFIKRLYIALISFSCYIVIWAIAKAKEKAMRGDNFMKVIGHRGASAYAPENTLAAFRLALEQGAHGIELDVMRTVDNRLAVIHDFTVERVSNGSGAVASKTIAELKALDFGVKYHKNYANERLPLLDEVLDFLSGNELLLNIEIKSMPGFYDEELNKLVAAAIDKSGLSDRIIISCFEHKALTDMKKLRPGLKTAMLYSKAIDKVWEYAKEIGVDYIHPQHQTIDKDCVASCHANNIGVNAWTVNKPEDIMRMLDIGADAIITDKPDSAIALLRG